MTRLSNSFDGGTDGVTISTGNSGGASGDAFDNILVTAPGTGTYNAANALFGGMCAAIDPANAASAYLAYNQNLGADLYGRVYVKFPVLPSSTQALVVFRDNATAATWGRLDVQTDGRIRLIDSTGGTIATTPNDATGKLVANSYARLEWHFVGHVSAGSLEVKMFLSPHSTTASSTTTITARNTGGAPDRLRIGQAGSAVTDLGVFYLDELVWDTVGYPGPPTFIPTPTVLAHGNGTGGLRTTASFTPHANKLILLWFGGLNGTEEEVPVLGGTATGITWTYQGWAYEYSTGKNLHCWTGLTSASPGAGTLTFSLSSGSGKSWHAVLEFGTEVDYADPIVQLRGRFVNIPPENGNELALNAHQEMAPFVDKRNAMSQFSIIGNTNGTFTDPPGWTRLGLSATEGVYLGSITEWRPNEELLITGPSWTTPAHYIAFCAEMRYAGGTPGGRIREKPMASNTNAQAASALDATAYTTLGFTTYANRDIYFAITSTRTGATPGQPTITNSGTALTWTLVDSVGYNSIASPVQKLWLFTARVGASDPGTMTVTATFPQTQTSAAWSVTEVRNAIAGALQFGHTSGDSGTAVAPTLSSTVASTSSTMLFLAKAASDVVASVEQITGTPESGWVPLDQSTATPVSISSSSFARNTPDQTPTFTLRASAAFAAIAIEVAADEEDKEVDLSLIDQAGTTFTPTKVGRGIVLGFIDNAPTLFAFSATGISQQVTSGGAFQGSAFEDDTFQIGTGLFVDNSPVLFALEVTGVDAQQITMPGPTATLTAFQTDAFDDDTFQQAAPAEGINITSTVFEPEVDHSNSTDQIVSLEGSGGWDSDIVVWDDPVHYWDEPNISGFINQAGAVFPPQQVKFSVTLGFIDQAPVLYDISTGQRRNVTMPFINNAGFTFTPQQFTQQITMPEALYFTEVPEPVIATDQTVELEFIDQEPVLYEWQTGVQQFDLPFIDQLAFPFTPIQVKFSVTLELIDQAGTPFVLIVNAIAVPLIDDAGTTFDLTSVVHNPDDITLDLIDNAGVLEDLDAIIGVFPQTVRFDDVDAGFIDNEGELLDIEFVPALPQSVILGFIDQRGRLLDLRVFTVTRPVITLHARYDPVSVKHARYDPVTLKHAQNARQG